MNRAELVSHCQKSIARGSKTFTFASRFFSREKMQDAALLYQWCRHCDDAIDASPPERKRQELEALRMKTQEALNGTATDVSFRALAYLVHKHSIPAHYPLELIEGMATDAEFAPPTTKQELKLYCYRVAGVVGLMMSHVMGISDEKALKHACDMGMAMQLTNIARDILDDWRIGRCYLPEDLLARHGLTFENFTSIENRPRLVKAVAEVLDWAEDDYLSGEAGTPYLDRKSALVILIARFTYARIGDKVRSAGPRAWDQRQFTSALEKFVCLLKAGWVWMRQLGGRGKFQGTAIRQVWRFQ